MVVVLIILIVVSSSALVFLALTLVHLNDIKQALESKNKEIDIINIELICWKSRARAALDLAKDLENLYNRTVKSVPPNQFTKSELKKLIILCHPDKHGNSELANKATAKLIHLRNQL